MSVQPQDTSPGLQPIWCVVDNVVAERPYGTGGTERRPGLKHFRYGAKLYIIDAFAGSCDRVVAIGHHSGSNRYARLVVDIHHVENFRSGLAYSPADLRIAAEHFKRGGDRGLRPGPRRCVRSSRDGRNSEADIVSRCRITAGCRRTRSICHSVCWRKGTRQLALAADRERINIYACNG